MKNKIARWMILILIIQIFNVPSEYKIFALNESEYLRIGLKELNEKKNQIQFENKNIVFGFLIDGQFKPDTAFQSTSSIQILPCMQTVVVSDQIFATMNEAVEASTLLKQNNLICTVMNKGLNQWVVVIMNYKTNEEAMAAIELINTYSSLHFTVLSDNTFRTVMNTSDAQILFDNQNIQGIFAGNDSTDPVPLIKIGNRKYRGYMEVNRFGRSTVTAINTINKELYLYSVVPSEMPPTFPIEALKAQAVAARSFATYYTTISKKYINEPYQLCDTVISQVYKGYTQEYQSTNNAVNQTIGEVVYFDNKIIECSYFSTSGGHTESSENVWSGAKPYYVGKPDLYETEPYKAPWTKTYTAVDIQNILLKKQIDIGIIAGLETVNISPSGRIMTLKVIGSKGTYLLEKETIRSWLGLLSRKCVIVSEGTPNTSMVTLLDGSTSNQYVSAKGLTVINGNADTIQLNAQEQIQVLSATGFNNIPLVAAIPGSFIFVGVGNGHGVGMSQSGAKGMANNGFSYVNILEYYYTGANVK